MSAQLRHIQAIECKAAALEKLDEFFSRPDGIIPCPPSIELRVGAYTLAIRCHGHAWPPRAGAGIGSFRTDS